MSRISNCPECGQQVTIADGFDETVLVRCPLCDGEFPLSEVTPQATKAPPELVPLAPIPQQSSAADVREAAAERPATDEPQLSIWEKVTTMPQIDTGVPDWAATGEGAVGTEAFHFGDAESEGPDRSIAATAYALARRRKKEKGILRELVGIVLGGIVGVSLAYYGLNLFGGERFDFANVYLPGIRHTVRHRPAWWPDWAKFEGGADKLDDQTLAPEKLEK